MIHNFWAQATKLGIFDNTTGLPELLDALIADYEEAFVEAIERRGYEVNYKM